MFREFSWLETHHKRVNKLLLLKTEAQNELDSLKLNLIIKINDNVHKLEKEIGINKKEISSLYLKLNDLKINLEEVINEVSGDIDKIKNSKYSKKIWLGKWKRF